MEWLQSLSRNSKTLVLLAVAAALVGAAWYWGWFGSDLLKGSVGNISGTPGSGLMGAGWTGPGPGAVAARMDPRHRTFMGTLGTGIPMSRVESEIQLAPTMGMPASVPQRTFEFAGHTVVQGADLPGPAGAALDTVWDPRMTRHIE